MNDQPMLFDVKRLGPITCSVCGATRQPDETKAQACTIDRDRQAGVLEHRRRPIGCLNAIDNTTAPFPDGY